MFYTISFLDSEFKVHTFDFEPINDSWLGVFRDRDKAVDLAMRLNEVLVNFPNPCWVPTKPGIDKYWHVYFDPIDLTFEACNDCFTGDLYWDSKTLPFRCFETKEDAEELARRLRCEV